MAPRKKKEEPVLITEEKSAEDLAINPIEEKSNQIDQALDMKLSDLEGIGTVRLKNFTQILFIPLMICYHVVKKNYREPWIYHMKMHQK